MQAARPFAYLEVCDRSGSGEIQGGDRLDATGSIALRATTPSMSSGGLVADPSPEGPIAGLFGDSSSAYRLAVRSAEAGAFHLVHINCVTFYWWII
uniref:Uncharacterized protein n=1 Tax=Oryza glumipatula TaxID=40148 RepID=A0A0E0A8X8_9ORYZ